MNKKNLSVVMAGAMLATSVAPVLAAEKYEVSSNKLGVLVDRLDTLLESKKFDENDRKGNDSAKTIFAGTSVYRIEIFDINGTPITSGEDSQKIMLAGSSTNSTVFSSTKELLTQIKANNVSAVKVWELGNTTDEKGRIISIGLTDGETGTIQTYDADEIKTLATEGAKGTEAADSGVTAGLKKAFTDGYVKKVESIGNNEVEITLSSVDSSTVEYNKIKVTVGSNELNFAKPVDKNGISLVGVDNSDLNKEIAGFASVVKGEVDPGKTPVSIAGPKAKALYEVKVASGDTLLKLDDLYDGFMLTQSGHELLNKINLNKKTYGSSSVSVSSISGSEIKTFTITLSDKSGTQIEKIVVRGTSQDKMDTLRTWLNRGYASVDILAGSNRYATAVEIAKTYVANQYTQDNVYDIVLVNGEALVDGLAAAPYAKAKGAPILLTSKNELPKETKDFLKELIKGSSIAGIENKTITIVGGESVVSESVEQELRNIGFKIKRLAGDNREETSLEVARELGNISGVTKDNAFVVGADGEADAMSIAAYAASGKDPVIVSSPKGLSNSAYRQLSNYSNSVKVIGGEAQISKDEEAKISEVTKASVSRIAGSNRQETNALVIKNYHKDFDNILVAKDGIKNKSELVDALPAALFASSTSMYNTAPIVLATNKLSDSQLNELVLNAKKPGKTVYQIGYGVDRNILNTIITKLGLNK